jgi:hypothetical protein
MRRSIDDAAESHPAGDDDKPPAPWMVQLLDDCEACVPSVRPLAGWLVGSCAGQAVATAHNPRPAVGFWALVLIQWAKLPTTPVPDAGASS